MSTLNCLIVDDEELARALLANYAARLPFLRVVGQCKDPLEAIAALHEQPVDLLLLDIQMPGLTGIELLKTLHHKPAVILTTAYSQYALEGYALDVADYLLKPFSFERFAQAINKVMDRRKPEPAPALPEPEPAKDYILVKSEHKVFRLKFDDIHYVESMREYVAYHTPQGRILSLYALKNLEEDLPAERFIRIHKSYIVAIQKVTALEGNMVVIGKDKLPIGASYKERVVAAIF